MGEGRPHGYGINTNAELTYDMAQHTSSHNYCKRCELLFTDEEAAKGYYSCPKCGGQAGVGGTVDHIPHQKFHLFLNSLNERTIKLTEQLEELGLKAPTQPVLAPKESERAEPTVFRVRVAGKTQIVGKRQHGLLYRVSQGEISIDKESHTWADLLSLQRLKERKIVKHRKGAFCLTELGEKILLALNHEVLDQCAILSGLPSTKSLQGAVEQVLDHLKKVEKVPPEEIKIAISWPNRKRK